MSISHYPASTLFAANSRGNCTVKANSSKHKQIQANASKCKQMQAKSSKSNPFPNAFHLIASIAGGPPLDI
jgi:hypothetical protein